MVVLVGKRSAALFLLVCAAIRAASAVNDGPLPNGNFEDSPDTSQMSGSTVTGENAIPKWKSSGRVEYVESGQKQGDTVLAVPEGARAVRLGNGASVQQQLAVTPGTYYSITFSAARTCAYAQKLSVSVVPGSSSQDGGMIPVQTVYSSSGWDSYCWAFRAESSAVTVVIRNPGQEDDPTCGPIIDAISIKTVNTQQASQGNLLKNGDFEEGPYISQVYQWGVLVPPTNDDEVTPLPGWKIMSYSKSVKYIGAGAGFAVPRGGRAVELVSGVETALVQDVDTVEGGSYRLEFTVGDAEGGCAASDSPMEVQAYAAQGRTSAPWGSSQGFTRGALEFTAVASRTRVVLVSSGYHIRSDGTGTLCGPVVDDVSLVSVSRPPARRLLR